MTLAMAAVGPDDYHCSPKRPDIDGGRDEQRRFALHTKAMARESDRDPLPGAT
jgi:hypothetical protein